MTKEDKIYALIHRWGEWRKGWIPCGVNWKAPNGKEMRWCYAENIIHKRRNDMLKRIIRIAGESK